MTRSIEMIGSGNFQGNFRATRRLTTSNLKRNDTKSLFTTLTKVPQCSESRMIENILGDFKEVYRLVSREKDYSTIVGIIPSKTGSIPSSQKKKLKMHSPGSYLDKLQSSAIRLKTENKGDSNMGPEEYELPNESPKCEDIKVMLEQMIVNITPITPLPSTPMIDRFNDHENTFKSCNQATLKDKTILIRTIIKPIEFVKASTFTESKRVQEINIFTPSESDIKKNSANSDITTKSADCDQSNAVESGNSSSSSSSSSIDSSESSDSESDSSSSEDSEVKNKQIVKRNAAGSSSAKPVRNILVPIRSLSDSSSDDEEPSKNKLKDLNKTANIKNSLNTSNNEFIKSPINGIVTTKLSNQFNGPQIPQQAAINQTIIQYKNCIQVDNLENRGPTYRTYPVRGVGKKRNVCSRRPNATCLSTLNTSSKKIDTKVCAQPSQSFETTKPFICEPNVPNIDEKCLRTIKSPSAKYLEETESHLKSSTLPVSSSSESSSSSSSNSSSSDSSSSSDCSSSSSDSEDEESPYTAVATNNSSDSQNAENIKIKNIPQENALFKKLDYSKNENLCFPEITSQNLKSTTPIVQEKVNSLVKDTKKVLKSKTIVDNRNIPSSNCNASQKPKSTCKPTNNTIKSSKTSNSKNIRSSKIKSREFIEDSDSSSDEYDSGRLSAARIRPFTNQNQRTNKTASLDSDLSSTISTATVISDAIPKTLSTRTNQQPFESNPNFATETVTISTIIPDKRNEQPSSSDADSESQSDDTIQKKCDKKFKVDSKKKQALPKVFGRMLYKGNSSQSYRNYNKTSKTETSQKSNNLKKENEREISKTSTSISKSMNRTPIKLKIDLKRLRCFKNDNETEDDKVQKYSYHSVDHKQKSDRIDVSRKLTETVREIDKLSKIPIKKKDPEDISRDRNGSTDHIQKHHQTKSINNHSKITTSNFSNSKLQPKRIVQSIAKNTKTHNIPTKQNIESNKRKRQKHDNKSKTFSPDYTKTKDNRYLPNSSTSKHDKVLKCTESSKVEGRHNNSFKTPKLLEGITTKSDSINDQNSSMLNKNERKHQRSLSSDRRDKDQQNSSSKNIENHLSKSEFMCKNEGASTSSSKDRAKKHKRESVDDFRHKHRRLDCDNSAEYQHQRMSSNHLEDTHKKSLSDHSQVDRESKHKTSDTNRQKSSSHNRKGSSSKNKRDDLKERTYLKTTDHKNHKQEERMSKGFESAVTDAAVKGQRTELDKKESDNQSSFKSRILSGTDNKTIKQEETHSKKGTDENKSDRHFLAPVKPALGGNSQPKEGRTSSDSSTELENPIKRRKPSANNCAGKRVKISQEQGNKEPEKTDPAVSPISSDWICEDDDESDERPGQFFANYASFVQKIDEIEILDRETLIGRGRELKHAADTDCYHMRQVLLYLDSCLYYMRATALPVPNDRTAASRLSLETLPLITFTRKRCSIEKSSEKNKDKFRIINILCLRCEGILYNHLFKLKQHQCFEIMREIEDFFDTGKGDLLRENTPPSSSPGREHPFLPSNRLLNTIQRQNAFLQYLTHSQMLWEKADKLTANFEDFFRELNVEYGEMSVYKPMTHVYNFTRGAIAKLLKQQ